MRVAVIIPCFNVEEYIEECLESVYSQVRLPDEIVCVDNNSTDRTWEVLINLKNTRYSNLVLLQEKRKGASYARNSGLEVVKSDWIQFLDADDLIKPDKIAHQLTIVNGQSDCSFVAAGYQKLSLDGTTCDVKVSEDRWLSAFINKGGITSSNLWNREALLQVGNWNGRLQSSQEADLMMRLLLTGRMVHVDNSLLTIIRERAAGQISQSNPVARYERFINVRLSYMTALNKNFPDVYERVYDELTTYLLSSILILAKYDTKTAIMCFNSMKLDSWTPRSGYGMSLSKAAIIKWFGMPFYVTITKIFS